MAQGDTPITLVGNAVADAELRFTPSGKAVATVRIASTPRYFDKGSSEWKDGETLWLTAVCWAPLAENVAESITQGTRVIVQGRLKQRNYETKEGEKRTVYEVDADEIGPSLKFASAKVNKAERKSDPGGYQATGNREPDPWASDASDEPPF